MGPGPYEGPSILCLARLASQVEVTARSRALHGEITRPSAFEAGERRGVPGHRSSTSRVGGGPTPITLHGSGLILLRQIDHGWHACRHGWRTEAA